MPQQPTQDNPTGEDGRAQHAVVFPVKEIDHCDNDVRAAVAQLKEEGSREEAFNKFHDRSVSLGAGRDPVAALGNLNQWDRAMQHDPRAAFAMAKGYSQIPLTREQREALQHDAKRSEPAQDKTDPDNIYADVKNAIAQLEGKSDPAKRKEAYGQARAILHEISDRHGGDVASFIESALSIERDLIQNPADAAPRVATAYAQASQSNATQQAIFGVMGKLERQIPDFGEAYPEMTAALQSGAVKLTGNNEKDLRAAYRHVQQNRVSPRGHGPWHDIEADVLRSVRKLGGR